MGQRVQFVGVNDAPVASDDKNMWRQNMLSPLSITNATDGVLSNDHDVDEGPLLSIVNAGNTLSGTHGDLVFTVMAATRIHRLKR